MSVGIKYCLDFVSESTTLLLISYIITIMKEKNFILVLEIDRSFINE